MGNSSAQNSQRGIVFLTFITLIFFLVVTVLNLVKNRIDPVEDGEEGEAGDAYRDKGEKKEENEEKREKKREKEKKKEPAVEQQSSQMQFDQNIISMKAQQIQEDDPPAIKIAKKNDEFMLSFFPIFMVFVLNIVTGTSKAFSLVDYLFTLAAVLLFNVLKVHRSSNSVYLNVMLQNLWLLLVFFQLLNVWTSTTIAMPYIVA